MIVWSGEVDAAWIHTKASASVKVKTGAGISLSRYEVLTCSESGVDLGMAVAIVQGQMHVGRVMVKR